MTRNQLKSWKINQIFIYISEYEKIVLNSDKNQCFLRETLNVNLKLEFHETWMSISRPRRIGKLCKILWKFRSKIGHKLGKTKDFWEDNGLKHSGQGTINVVRSNDRHLLESFSKFIYADICISLSTSWLVILQRKKRIKNHVKWLWRNLSGK